MFDVSQMDVAAAIVVTTRIVLSSVLGALIGVDRVKKRRPAGIKTHALVCMGAALVMLTDEFVWKNGGMTTNLTRMSAQVISGVGFLGAGTIMVTGRNQVKGLTTAAGLWFSACLGLAIGCGFYLAAFVSSFMVFVIVKIFARFDTYLQARSLIMDLYLEHDPDMSIAKLLIEIKKADCVIIELENGHSLMNESGLNHPSLLMSIQVPKKTSHEEVVTRLGKIAGVTYIEQA